MLEVSSSQLSDKLIEVGVSAGDGLLVHSALHVLGRPLGGTQMYLDTLQDAVGKAGTLVVPTFNFAFARGEDYDPAETPADKMGAFSEFFRQQPEARRTSHPMQSFCAIGSDADSLAGLDTPSAFDDGSAVDYMVKNGYKLLLLGADIQAASILHYSEQRVGMPYRYWKDFRGRILRGGDWQDSTYRMYVRDMEIDARLEIYEIETVLRQQGQWASVDLNYGKISLASLADFVAVTSSLLKEDPWRWVVNRPELNA
jgi:aminoglycoside N3'-acetyltransferase